MPDQLRLAFNSPVVIMDSETGGLSPNPNIRWGDINTQHIKKNDQLSGVVVEPPSPILQISAVKLNQQTLVEEGYFDTLVGPNKGETVKQYLKRCNPEALEVNNIDKRQDELKNAPPLETAMKNFLQWLPKWYTIAGQNVQFDLNFFNAALDFLSNDYRFVSQPLELTAFTKLYFALPDTCIVANYKLENVASALGIDTSKAHDSLADCRITAEVMRRIFKRFSLK